jgi:hypothetical protein
LRAFLGIDGLGSKLDAPATPGNGAGGANGLRSTD